MLELYPEERQGRAPAAARVFEILETLQRHVLMDHGNVTRVFPPEVAELPRKILGCSACPDVASATIQPDGPYMGTILISSPAERRAERHTWIVIGNSRHLCNTPVWAGFQPI